MRRHHHRPVKVLSCCHRCNLLLILNIDSYEMFLFLIIFPMNNKKKKPKQNHTKKQHLNMDRLRTPNFLPKQLQFVWFICFHLTYVCIFAISIIFVFSYSNRFHFENSNTRVHIQLPCNFQFISYFYWVFCYSAIWNTYLNH